MLNTLLFPKAQLPAAALQKLEGKTVVITGASFGIGKELALLLSTYKMHLILIARTRHALAELCEKAKKNGSSARYLIADFYDEAAVEKLLELLKKEVSIHFFVSNAGKSICRSLHDTLNRFHDVTRTNRINYLTPVQLLLELFPLLAKSNATVINVSAVNVLLLPAPKWAVYQASKSAFDQWFRCNIAEWRKSGIRAKTLYLPLVKTRMIAPNPVYANAPAMTASQAAIRIVKLMLSSRTYSKPWWLIFPESLGFLGRKAWERW